MSTLEDQQKEYQSDLDYVWYLNMFNPADADDLTKSLEQYVQVVCNANISIVF